MKNTLVAIAGILSGIYLVFPTLGIFELLPDYIPFVGNLDEATASAVLLSALRYFGWDITNMFKRGPVLPPPVK